MKSPRSHRGRAWRWAAVSLTAAATLALAGCTVPSAGLAGIGVDADGFLRGYIHICDSKYHVDGATLYYDLGTKDGTPVTPDAGTWASPVPITGTANWSLSASNEGWTTETPLEKLVAGRKYTLYGWSRDNSSAAAHTSFTLADLADLEPGEILHSGPSGEYSWGDVNEVSSLAKFQERACEVAYP